MIKLLPILNETIYGENAIVYHRTRIDDLANKLYTNGWQLGIGDKHGVGFYATYDLESQVKDGMANKYGDIIAKFSCPTTDFFFFDWPEFKKTALCKKLKCTEDDFIFKQLDHFDLQYDINKIYELISSTTDGYTGGIALHFVKYIRQFQGHVRGIIFTNKMDGKVLVSYDIKRMIPIGYSTDYGKSWIRYDISSEYVRSANKSKLIGLSKIEKLLAGYEIRNYKIRPDGIIDINGDVEIANRGLSQMPVIFGNVSGYSICDDNKITSYVGWPVSVGKDIYCRNNIPELKESDIRAICKVKGAVYV